MNTDEFILGEVTLDPFDVEDNLLEFEEDDPNITDDFIDTECGDEINIDSPIKEKSQDQIASEIEDLFLSLLAQADYETLLALTGDSPYATDIVSEDFFRGFSGNYSRAVLYNPALRWYSKLLKLLPEGKFSIEGGSLKLKISPQFFKKTVYPFFGDFKLGLRESSPIIDLMYSLAESIKDKDVQTKLNMLSESQRIHRPDEEGFNPGEVNFEENMMNPIVKESDLRLDDSDSMGGTSVDFNNNPSINIKLQDLANKTIAQYLLENNITDQSAIASKLTEEGFPK